MSNNQPMETFRDGRLKATLWLNQSKDGDEYATVTLSKTYEDRDGKLQDTSTFSENELLRVVELAREARGFLLDQRRERSHDRKAERQAEQEQDGRSSRPRRFRNQPEPGMGR